MSHDDHDIEAITSQAEAGLRSAIMLAGGAAERWASRKADQARAAAQEEREASAAARHLARDEQRAKEKQLTQWKDAAKIVYSPLMTEQGFNRASPARIIAGYTAAAAMKDMDPRAFIAVQAIEQGLEERFGMSIEELRVETHAAAKSERTPAHEPSERTGTTDTTGRDATRMAYEPIAPEPPATEPQKAYLRGAFGVSGEGMTREEASATLTLLEKGTYTDEAISSMTNRKLDRLWALSEHATTGTPALREEVSRRLGEAVEASLQQRNDAPLTDRVEGLIAASDNSSQAQNLLAEANSERAEAADHEREANTLDAEGDSHQHATVDLTDIDADNFSQNRNGQTSDTSGASSARSEADRERTQAGTHHGIAARLESSAGLAQHDSATGLSPDGQRAWSASQTAHTTTAVDAVHSVTRENTRARKSRKTSNHRAPDKGR